MSPKLKLILTISLKQAIGAILASSLIASKWHFLFNFDNRAGQLAVLQLLGSIIVAREIQVWGSKFGKWLFSNNDPSELDKLDVAEEKAKETVAAVQDAQQARKP